MKEELKRIILDCEGDRDDIVFDVMEFLKNKAILPDRLTAENGAKGLLIGEFKESHEVSFEDEEGNTIEEVIEVPVSWDNIKNIYKKIVLNSFN